MEDPIYNLSKDFCRTMRPITRLVMAVSSYDILVQDPSSIKACLGQTRQVYPSIKERSCNWVLQCSPNFEAEQSKKTIPPHVAR